MTNAEYQKRRIGQGGSLLHTLHEVIEMHCEENGLEPVSALTDALTDMRHLADVYGLDFGEIDARAYDGYIEESQAAQSEVQL